MQSTCWPSKNFLVHGKPDNCSQPPPVPFESLPGEPLGDVDM